MFSVKKCDQLQCNVCQPPILPNSIFSTLYHLPDPIPNGELYKPFMDVYGSETSEKHLPSLKEKEGKGHGIVGFNPSAQTSKNTGILLICSDCSKPRLVHSKKKLQPAEKLFIEALVETVTYSCGANIRNIDVEDEGERGILLKVFVRQNLLCNTMIELPYYTSGYDHICIYCGNDDNLVVGDGVYPLCTKCKRSKKVAKKRRGGKAPSKG